AWVVVSELVKSHTKTSTYTNKRAQLCTSHYFLDKQQDKFKLSFLSLVLLGIFFSPVGSAAIFLDGSRAADGSFQGSDEVLLVLVFLVGLGMVLLLLVSYHTLKIGLLLR
ncbi:hypothetical protein V2H81_11250, partial [Glaesserella parasuis]|uniref:hypothetical protein n=1 Tax=Glaesserella parasuis TaxID=738 RepID=UPI002EC2ACCE|nr:hypothetical protein [Glaesserella parasuis]